jgi:hypothetical protein
MPWNRVAGDVADITGNEQENTRRQKRNRACGKCGSKSNIREFEHADCSLTFNPAQSLDVPITFGNASMIGSLTQAVRCVYRKHRPS